MTTAIAEPSARRKFWGWGRKARASADRDRGSSGPTFAERFGFDGVRMREPPRVEELDLRRSAAGAAGLDRRAFQRGPVRPRGAHVRPVVPRPGAGLPPRLRACARSGRVSPRRAGCGGGAGMVQRRTRSRRSRSAGARASSGGVEPDVGDGYRGTVSIDLRRPRRRAGGRRHLASRADRGGHAGTCSSRRQLKPHGLTLRHFPQSFEWSTLGGWIATRSGGHFATLHTHIDEFVEAVRVVTPRGVLRDPAAAGLGRGPLARAPGLRLGGHAGRHHRGLDAPAASARSIAPAPRSTSLTSTTAVEASRELAQSGLHPSNCRLLGPRRGAALGERRRLARDPRASASSPAITSSSRGWRARWRSRPPIGGERQSRHEPAMTRPGRGVAGRLPARAAPARRLRAARPGQRDVRDRGHVGSFPGVPRGRARGDAARGAARRVAAARCPAASPTCIPTARRRTTRSTRPVGRDQELEQWDAIKAAASEAILALGGTITHHHAVGRDHAPWYRREVPELFTAALGAAKAELDPAGIMNPGVLLPAGRGASAATTEA